MSANQTAALCLRRQANELRGRASDAASAVSSGRGRASDEFRAAWSRVAAVQRLAAQLLDDEAAALEAEQPKQEQS